MLSNKIIKLAMRFGTFSGQELLALKRLTTELNESTTPITLSPQQEMSLYQYFCLTGCRLSGQADALMDKYFRLSLMAEGMDGENLAQLDLPGKQPIYFGYSFPHRPKRAVSWEISFTPGDIVWEIGCGEGHDLIRMAQKYPNTCFYGCEANAYNLRAALFSADNILNSQANIRLLLGDFSEKIIPDGSVQAIVLKGTIAGMRADIKKRLLGSIIKALSANSGRIYVDYLYLDGQDKATLELFAGIRNLEFQAYPVSTDPVLNEEDRPIMLEFNRRKT